MNLLDRVRSRGADNSHPGGVPASAVVLVGANLLPLVGVFAWGWDVLNVVALYWFENVLIGVINVIKMLCSAPDAKQLNLAAVLRGRAAVMKGELSARELEQLQTAEKALSGVGSGISGFNHASKLFLVPFFTVHYGFFCFGHGISVFALLGGRGAGMPDISSSFPELLQAAVAAGGIWGALALGASHLYSFFVNYLGRGEFRRTAAAALMIAPYGRVVVLHIAILFGGFVTEFFGSPAFLLALLIFGKIALDLVFHRRSHRKLAVRQDV